MTKVYLVTSGEELYNIEGVFSEDNEILANVFKDAIPNSSVHTYELNNTSFKTNINKKIISGYKCYRVWINGDGETEKTEMINPIYYGFIGKRLFDNDYSIVPYKKIWYDQWDLEVWAKSEEEAKKKADKKRIELQKTGEWYKEEL